jgi:hypothetical protein
MLDVCSFEEDMPDAVLVKVLLKLEPRLELLCALSEAKLPLEDAADMELLGEAEFELVANMLDWLVVLGVGGANESNLPPQTLLFVNCGLKEFFI